MKQLNNNMKGNMTIMWIVLFNILAGVAQADWCRFNITVGQQDIATVDKIARAYWFSGQGMREVRMTLDLPEGDSSSEWIDFIWSVGDKRGRFSAYGDVTFYRRGADLGSRFSCRFVTGYGIKYPISAYVELKVLDGQSCARGRSNSTDAPKIVTNNTGSVRRKRELKTPMWVELDGAEHHDFVFVWPIVSLFGVNGIALAGGAQVYGPHDYVQLPTHESSKYALQVPGMFVAGPNYVYSTDGGHFYQGRSLFKYSRRDAAWVLWDYQNGKPAWNGDRDPDYWKHRTCAVPGEMPGTVFDLTDDD